MLRGAAVFAALLTGGAAHAAEIVIDAPTTISTSLVGFDLFIGKANVSPFAVTIAPGAVVTSDGDPSNGFEGLRAASQSLVTMVGGTVNNVLTTEGATFTISGGTLFDLDARSVNPATILGGQVGSARTRTGFLDVYGGTFLNGLGLANLSTGGGLRLFGSGLALSGATPNTLNGIPGTVYELNGTLSTGQAISTLVFDRRNGAGIVISNAAAPEPSALILMGLGLVPWMRRAVRSRRRGTGHIGMAAGRA
jgi:hypothetical protein